MAVLAAWVSVTGLFSQPKFTNPSRFSHRDGLPDNRVRCITQDGAGFMWFGTHDGLCRYDGSAAEVFRNIPGDSLSLSDNFINSIFYDEQRDGLWIGTKSGLNFLNLCTGKFKQYLNTPGKAGSLPGDEISKTMFKDRQGALWVGLSQEGLLRYIPSRDQFDHYAYQPGGAEKGSRLNRINHITKIGQDLYNDSILWAGTASGLLKFNKYRKEFTRYYYLAADGRSNILLNAVETFYLLPDGRLLLGCWGGFLVLFDPANGSFSHFSATLNTARFPEKQGVVYDILRKSDTEVWASTKQGMIVYDFDCGSITSEQLNDPETNAYYRASFLDRGGRVWGKSSEGVYCYGPLSEQFRNFSLDPFCTAKRFVVSDVLPARKESKLYAVIPGGKGLYTLDPPTGQWSVIPAAASFLNSRNAFKLRSALFLRDGRLLLVEENRLFTLSSNGKSLVPFPVQPNGLAAKYMEALQDRQGRVWITSVDGGLFSMDLGNESILNFKDGLLGKEEQGKGILIKAIFEDSRHNLWIAVNDGYSVYDSRRDRFLNFRLDRDTAYAFRSIENFAEGPSGRILLAGGHDGIGIANALDPGQGITGRLEIAADTPVKPAGIVKDKQGNFWCYDEKNLKKINARDETLEKFDGFHGLRSKKDDPEYLPINGLRALPDGQIAVLYKDGLGFSLFHPDSLRKNEELPQPYVRSFSVLGQKTAADTSLYYLSRITLPYSRNFFSFEFSAIAYIQPHRVRFKYKLEGLDKDWIYPPANRPYASYSNVWEGKYTLKIMAANSEGIWNHRPYTLKIHILPPWYRSWWALLLYAAAIAGAGFAAYRFLRYRLMIEMKLEQDRAEAQRLYELDEAKTRLYTNITHEFRTPLTVISGMAEQIHENPGRWLEEGTEMIGRHSANLLHLVGQMLALSRLEAGMLAVHLEQGDIVAYIRYLAESFHSSAAAKNISLSFESQWESLAMDFDPDKIMMIVSNLLSNAIKFTPEGGSVRVRLAPPGAPAIFSAEPAAIQLAVEDTGAGIPAESLPLIFGRFHQLDGTAGGSGIGLALAKELVHLLGGEIGVESSPGRGSVFTLTLPARRAAAPGPVHGRLAPAPKRQPAPANPPAPGPDKRPILQIAEDNADVVRYLRACLESSYQLLTASTGDMALGQARAQVPDLIISDIMMPGLDGFELCRALKTDERTSHIPILLLTARADHHSRLEGLQHGADAYLVKPFNKEELLLQIQNLLEGRRKLQAHYLALATLPAPAAGATANEENAFVLKIRAIAEAHLDDPGFEVEQLCREAGMSKSNLHRKLTALTGHSANRFIRRIRLSKACAMLRDPSRSIVAIAYDCGFNDAVYFTRMFRQEFGMTPSEWRSRNSG